MWVRAPPCCRRPALSRPSSASPHSPSLRAFPSHVCQLQARYVESCSVKVSHKPRRHGQAGHGQARSAAATCTPRRRLLLQLLVQSHIIHSTAPPPPLAPSGIILITCCRCRGRSSRHRRCDRGWLRGRRRCWLRHLRRSGSWGGSSCCRQFGSFCRTRRRVLLPLQSLPASLFGFLGLRLGTHPLLMLPLSLQELAGGWGRSIN